MKRKDTIKKLIHKGNKVGGYKPIILTNYAGLPIKLFHQKHFDHKKYPKSSTRHEKRR